jgi:hypothetical protein
MNQARIHPRSASDTSAFFQAIAGLAVALLVMLGVGGTAFQLVAPGGWLASLFDRSLAGGMAAILAFLIFGLCVQQTCRYISVGSRNRHVELFVYGFAAAGLLYAFEFFARGGY